MPGSLIPYTNIIITNDLFDYTLYPKEIIVSLIRPTTS